MVNWYLFAVADVYLCGRYMEYTVLNDDVNLILQILGWTPSSFVSSRVKKAEYSHQKPEDFMDQEVSGCMVVVCMTSMLVSQILHVCNIKSYI